jgi:monofunctional biosynthetic peptidoglycan transglycosylase
LAFLLWNAYAELPEVGALSRLNPKTTALMESRAQEARDKKQKPRRIQRWVSISTLPKHAVSAVLVSEDAAFYQHEGVDTHELRKAMEEAWAKGELGRGASTITQQLAKNLWLSGDRSLWRKLKELILAKRLERLLTKDRILTLYLNLVEWGDGIYGIDAAAEAHFSVPASALTVAQSAMLAAMLPSPRRWTVASKHPRLRQRSLHILNVLERGRKISAEDAAAARAEVERALSKAPPPKPIFPSERPVPELAAPEPFFSDDEAADEEAEPDEGR